MRAIYFKQESETEMVWQKYQGDQWWFEGNIDKNFVSQSQIVPQTQ